MTGSAVVPALRIPDYELLQLVGRGSYGEVWMAHNALGSLRAVKVVWRKNFEDERPYEREFRGIRKFEPVSRKHEGLIDLYHVGRNNDEGYFYYAMELADDAAPVIASEGEYRPRTLREELRARGRLTIDKAMEIGIKLASALEHLHRAGLIHRDIKPSNIIFVDGAPKLADIGLVAGISDARSFVGTEGFVPPEGPGTPGADIFSLGKVLYETSTGLDRNDFPKLPPLGADSGIDPGKFSQFNEVLLRACEPSPQSRYRTAEELLNDLLWIRKGKSLCRWRSWQRRQAFIWKIGAAAVGVAVLGLGMFLAASRYQQAASRPALGHFEKSELQKVEELFEKDDADGALASLARIVRSNPNDRPAAERLMAALTWRNFMVPSVEPIAVESRPRFISFSPDGEEVALALSNGALQFRNAATGERTWEEQASEDGVTAMAWSPDRTHLIVTGQRSGRIYNALSRRSIVEGLVHDSRIVSVQFSPGQPWILTGASSGIAQVWDAHDAQPVAKSFAHDGPIRQAMFSPDGRYVATAGLGDGAIRIWDFTTMQPTSPLLRQGRSINAMAFSRNSRLLATASDDGTAHIWRIPDGSLRKSLGQEGNVSDVIFSPDGSTLATASENGMAILWDLETRKPIGNPMLHRAAVRKAQFSPDGLKLVTLSDDRSVRLWDVTTAQPLSEPMRHPRTVENVAFSPTGERMATAGPSATEGSLWLWRPTPRGAMSRSFKISGNKRSAHLVRQTGQFCIADGQSLRIWPSIDSEEEPGIIDLGVPVDSFKLATNGTFCVAVSANNAWVWDLTSRQSIMGPLWHPTDILGAEFSPDRSRLAVATTGGHLMLWQVEGTTNQHKFHQFLPLPGMTQPTDEDGAVAVHFSPDGQLVLAACRNGKARIFDARTANPLVNLPHKHWMLSAEFSPDGRRIITASDRNAQVWDTDTGKPIGQPLHHDNDVLTGCFSPDGLRVLTTSRDWTARVWDAQTGRPISEPLRHSGPVLTACFGPDGVRVATGSADETARIWDAEIGQPLTDPFRYSGPVQHVEFTTDGSGLLVVPATGDVQLIDVLQVRLPAPSWLPALAEAVARQRLNERQMTEPVSAEQFFRLKRELNSLPDSAENVRWAKWFMAEPAQRTISPNSTIGLSAYRDGLLRAGTKAALRQAIRLDPTDALAHARLAELLVSPEQTMTGRNFYEAEWHERYARKLQPESKDISRLCEAIASRLNAMRPDPASSKSR